MIREKELIRSLVESAGVEINGNRPHDIKVRNDQFYQRVMKDGVLGLGEAYMDGWWDCDRLDMLFEKLLNARLDDKAPMPLHFKFKLMLAKIINFQTKTKAKEVAREHYDLGNDLFVAMLDKSLNYSCGYWKNAQTLDEAQQNKMDLICRKLKLEPGMRLLDIGCGFGGLAKFAAVNYGVTVVGITISQQQYDFAKNVCRGLPVDIRIQDYRDINEEFDRIVSVGMFEHVGPLNYRKYMEVAHKSLKPHGIFLLHTLGLNETSLFANEWMTKYIFPNGSLPSPLTVGKAIEKLFVLEDWHNFGVYYDNTLRAWHHNFIAHWDELRKQYNEKFYRMWTYYLLSCAGSFRARFNQLWQIVLSKDGVYGGYESVR